MISVQSFSFVMSVRQTVENHWTDFHEILHSGVIQNVSTHSNFVWNRTITDSGQLGRMCPWNRLYYHVWRICGESSRWRHRSPISHQTPHPTRRSLTTVGYDIDDVIRKGKLPLITTNATYERTFMNWKSTSNNAENEQEVQRVHKLVDNLKGV